MLPVEISLQDIGGFLSSPAWGGIGVIISSSLSITAIMLTLYSHPQQPQTPVLLSAPLKEILMSKNF